MKYLLIVIILCFGLSGVAQIPDSPIVNLSDVIAEVGLVSPSSLSNCFSAAVPEGFDPVYSKPGDWLSEFRNYSGSFNIENSVHDSTFTFKDGSNNPYSHNGISFNADGTKMYSVDGGQDLIFQFTLGTAYAVESFIPSSFVSKTTLPNSAIPNSSELSSDGTKMYISPFAAVNRIDTWTLSTPFDVSTATFSFSTTMPSTSGSDLINGSSMTPNGLIFTIGTSTGIFKYNLGTAFNMSTATFDSKFDNGAYVYGIDWSSDGKNLIYAKGQSGTLLKQERFSTSFDFSSNFGTTRTFDVSPPAVTFNSIDLVTTSKYIISDPSSETALIFNL